ncbi:hypothetical protein ACI3ET_09650 [Ornithinimicrobium sp. LYQ121]|uniref:hypothetical protein n=1 Tax=Ornithinimicrobium sp. LYQ121 TaxID=3378801 RepID=UPI0038534305
MDQHELLIRHAVAWAEKRRQPLDRDLLQTVLELRDFHDATAPQDWPAGSAEHLMLVRWPSHGPSGEPDVERLVATLDSFWRFLRGTGRMASSSADPRALTKEARRAAQAMPAACADPSRHGATKSLIEFGESIGLSLEGVASVEEANQRLQQIVEAWNALPQDQRHALSSPSAHQGSLRGIAATELLAGALGDGELGDGDVVDDDDPWGLADDSGIIPFADLTEVAAGVRSSPFVQQCRRLAEWVGRGKEVTPKEVLRLAPAREVYDVLGLWEWERGEQQLWDAAGDQLDLPLRSEELLSTAARDSFRSAADCRPLDRLWLPSLEAGLLAIEGRRAVAVGAEPRSDEEWRHLGVMLLASLLIHTEPLYVHAVVGALVHLLDPARHTLPLDDLEDWWWQSPRNPYAGPGEGRTWRTASDRLLRRALHEMDDTGVWRREGGQLRPTPLGHDVALLSAQLAEAGVIEG